MKVNKVTLNILLPLVCYFLKVTRYVTWLGLHFWKCTSVPYTTSDLMWWLSSQTRACMMHVVQSLQCGYWLAMSLCGVELTACCSDAKSQMRRGNAFGRSCLYVCNALTYESLGLKSLFLLCRYTSKSLGQISVSTRSSGQSRKRRADQHTASPHLHSPDYGDTSRPMGVERNMETCYRRHRTTQNQRHGRRSRTGRTGSNSDG